MISKWSRHTWIRPDLKFINDWAEAKKSNMSPDLTVKATIKSAGGRLQGLPYSKLGVNLTCRQQSIHVDSFHLDALEGSLSGQGHLVLAADKQPRYQTNFEVDKISVQKTIELAGLDPDLITGTLSVKGNLAGVGLSIGELKRSTAGNSTSGWKKVPCVNSRSFRKSFPFLMSHSF